MAVKQNLSKNIDAGTTDKAFAAAKADLNTTPFPSGAHELLSIILSVSDAYLILVDRNLKIQLFSNDVPKLTKKYFGITVQKGMSILEIVLPERREMIRKIYASVFDGKTQETEVCFETSNGTVYLHNCFRPAKNSDGIILGAIVNATNITEKRKAGLEILKSKNNLDLLLNNTQEYFLMIDRDFRVILMNQALVKDVQRLLGREVHIGDNILSIDPTQGKEKDQERIQNVLKAFEGQTIISGFVIKKKNSDSFIHFESYYKPAYNDKNEVTAVIITTRNITDTIKAKQQLVESEERWRFALEGSNQGLWDWNITTGEVYYSESYKKLYGYADEDLKGLVDDWQKKIHPDDKKLVEDNLNKHLSSDDPYFESIYRFHLKNGNYRWILARGMIVSRDEEGSPLRMIGTHTDITESKAQDESFRMLFYNHPLPMWTYDMDTFRFIEINDAAVQHYGYSRDEFLSMTIKDIRPKDEIEHLELVVENIKKNKPYQYRDVWKHLKKNGETILVQIKSKVLERNNKKFSFVSINDVTEKIKAEKELQESENQYRILFKNNPLPSLIYDIVTLKFLEVNDAAIKFYGYSKEEFLQRRLPDLYPPEQWILMEKVKKKEKNKKEIYQQQWKHLKKNGEINIVNFRSSTILYNHAEARLKVIEDVTAKVKAEKELKDSNERFTLAVKATSDAIYDYSLNDGKISWGNGLKKLFGYDSDEVNFKTWDDLIHENERSNVIKSITQALNNTHKSYWKEEYRFKKKDGTYSHVLDRGYILRNANKEAVRMIGAMQDITDLKIKEKELEKSKERFDTVLSATHDLIWDWNLVTGTFYRDREGLEQVYGVKNAASIQNIYNWLQRIHPDDQKHVQKTIDKILHATKEEVFEVEYRFKRDDGTYSYVYDRGKILCNAEGRPERMIGAAQDITERKKLEQQLLQKELEKQKIISKATIETQEQERTEIGKELHDNINQVLTTTKLYLELSLTNPELKDELIQKSSKNVLYVINEIKQLSRSLMNPSIGDLGLVDSINDLVENINLTRKVHIVINASEEVDTVLSENNKLMIFRIIQETLNNAVKHANANTVLLNLKKTKSKLLVTIFDDGIGFDPSSVKKGAGLKSIQNRVYLANGSLQINSMPGKGCKISITFPLNNSNILKQHG